MLGKKKKRRHIPLAISLPRAPRAGLLPLHVPCCPRRQASPRPSQATGERRPTMPSHCRAPRTLLSAALSPCWGRHLRPLPKAVGCKQRGGRNGEASCEGKEDAPEGPRVKGGERRQFPTNGRRRGCTLWRRDIRRSGSDGPFDEAAKTLKGRPTVRNVYGVSCPTVIPLHCVDYCNITRLPQEYSQMLAVAG